jgi:hypothetical protein
LKHETASATPQDLLDKLALPDNLGSVRDVFRGDIRKGLFIHIQDAHVNEDAQKNIRAIIDFLHANFGISLVLLEGGEGGFDTLFFRSIPDEGVKDKVIRNYMRQGGLSGPEAASITGEFSQIRYFGVEDQRLFNDNKRAFLTASEREKEILDRLKIRRNELEAQGSTFISDDVRNFYEAARKFETESGELLAYLKVLKGLRTNEGSVADKYPEIGRVFKAVEAQEKLSKNDTEAAMKVWIQHLEPLRRSGLSRENNIRFGGLLQSRATGAVSDGMFALEARKIFEEAGLNIEIPDFLKEHEHVATSLAEIQGTKLFTELKMLERSLRELLPQSEEEKTLLQKLCRMMLLIKLARLELTREEWEELAASRSDWENEATGGNDMWAASKKFYELALERDESLFRKALAKQNEQKTDCGILVTGGFHFEGLSRKLKESGISYVSIMPAIRNVEERNLYLDVMRGKSSWMKYFEGNLWNAFARDFTEKTLQIVSVPEQGQFLKTWRDRIIQNAMREDKIAQVSRYTRHIDQAARSVEDSAQGADKLSEEINAKFELFSRELAKLWKTGDLTPQSLGAIFDRIRATPVNSSLGTDLKFIPGTEVVFSVPFEEQSVISAFSLDAGQENDRLEMRDDPVQLEPLSLLPLVSVYRPNEVIFRMIFNRINGTFQEETGWSQSQGLPVPSFPTAVYHSSRGPISKSLIKHRFVPALNNAISELISRSPATDMFWQNVLQRMTFYIFEGDEVAQFYPHPEQPAVGINFETLVGLASADDSVRERSHEQFSWALNQVRFLAADINESYRDRLNSSPTYPETVITDFLYRATGYMLPYFVTDFLGRMERALHQLSFHNFYYSMRFYSFDRSQRLVGFFDFLDSLQRILSLRFIHIFPDRFLQAASLANNLLAAQENPDLLLGAGAEELRAIQRMAENLNQQNGTSNFDFLNAVLQFVWNHSTSHRYEIGEWWDRMNYDVYHPHHLWSAGPDLNAVLTPREIKRINNMPLRGASDVMQVFKFLEHGYRGWRGRLQFLIDLSLWGVTLPFQGVMMVIRFLAGIPSFFRWLRTWGADMRSRLFQSQVLPEIEVIEHEAEPQRAQEERTHAEPPASRRPQSQALEVVPPDGLRHRHLLFQTTAELEDHQQGRAEMRGLRYGWQGFESANPDDRAVNFTWQVAGSGRWSAPTTPAMRGELIIGVLNAAVRQVQQRGRDCGFDLNSQLLATLDFNVFSGEPDSYLIQTGPNGRPLLGINIRVLQGIARDWNIQLDWWDRVSVSAEGAPSPHFENFVQILLHNLFLIRNLQNGALAQRHAQSAAMVKDILDVARGFTRHADTTEISRIIRQYQIVPSVQPSQIVTSDANMPANSVLLEDVFLSASGERLNLNRYETAVIDSLPLRDESDFLVIIDIIQSARYRGLSGWRRYWTERFWGWLSARVVDTFEGVTWGIGRFLWWLSGPFRHWRWTIPIVVFIAAWLSTSGKWLDSVTDTVGDLLRKLSGGREMNQPEEEELPQIDEGRLKQMEIQRIYDDSQQDAEKAAEEVLKKPELREYVDRLIDQKETLGETFPDAVRVVVDAAERMREQQDKPEIPPTAEMPAPIEEMTPARAGVKTEAEKVEDTVKTWMEKNQLTPEQVVDQSDAEGTPETVKKGLDELTQKARQTLEEGKPLTDVMPPEDAKIAGELVKKLDREKLAGKIDDLTEQHPTAEGVREALEGNPDLARELTESAQKVDAEKLPGEAQRVIRAAEAVVAGKKLEETIKRTMPEAAAQGDTEAESMKKVLGEDSPAAKELKTDVLDAAGKKVQAEVDAGLAELEKMEQDFRDASKDRRASMTENDKLSFFARGKHLSPDELDAVKRKIAMLALDPSSQRALLAAEAIANLSDSEAARLRAVLAIEKARGNLGLEDKQSEELSEEWQLLKMLQLMGGLRLGGPQSQEAPYRVTQQVIAYYQRVLEIMRDLETLISGMPEGEAKKNAQDFLEAFRTYGALYNFPEKPSETGYVAAARILFEQKRAIKKAFVDYRNYMSYPALLRLAVLVHEGKHLQSIKDSYALKRLVDAFLVFEAGYLGDDDALLQNKTMQAKLEQIISLYIWEEFNAYRAQFEFLDGFFNLAEYEKIPATDTVRRTAYITRFMKAQNIDESHRKTVESEVEMMIRFLRHPLEARKWYFANFSYIPYNNYQRYHSLMMKLEELRGNIRIDRSKGQVVWEGGVQRTVYPIEILKPEEFLKFLADPIPVPQEFAEELPPLAPEPGEFDRVLNRLRNTDGRIGGDAPGAQGHLPDGGASPRMAEFDPMDIVNARGDDSMKLDQEEGARALEIMDQLLGTVENPGTLITNLRKLADGGIKDSYKARQVIELTERLLAQLASNPLNRRPEVGLDRVFLERVEAFFEKYHKEKSKAGQAIASHMLILIADAAQIGVEIDGHYLEFAFDALRNDLHPESTAMADPLLTIILASSDRDALLRRYLKLYEELLAKYGRTDAGTREDNAASSARWVREHMILSLQGRLVVSIPVTDEMLDFLTRHFGGADSSKICQVLAKLLLESDRRTDILERLFTLAERDEALCGPLWEVLLDALKGQKMKFEPEWITRTVKLYDTWIQGMIQKGVKRLDSDRYRQGNWYAHFFDELLTELLPVLSDDQREQFIAAVLAHVEKGFIHESVAEILLKDPKTGDKVAGAIARLLAKGESDEATVTLIKSLGPYLTVDVMDRAWAQSSGKVVSQKGAGLNHYLESLLVRVLATEKPASDLNLGFQNGHWRVGSSDKVSGVLPMLFQHGAEDTRIGILALLNKHLVALSRKTGGLTDLEIKEFNYLIHVLSFAGKQAKVPALLTALSLLRDTAGNKQLQDFHDQLLAIAVLLGDGFEDEVLAPQDPFAVSILPTVTGYLSDQQLWREAVTILGFWGTPQSQNELIDFWQKHPQRQNDPVLIVAMARSGAHRSDIERSLIRAYFSFLRGEVPADGKSYGNYQWASRFTEQESSLSENGKHEVFLGLCRILEENQAFRDEAIAALEAYPVDRADIKPDAVVLLLGLVKSAEKDARIRPILKKFASSPHPALQIAALYGLQQIEKPEAILPLFIAKLKSPSTPEGVRLFVLESFRYGARLKDKDMEKFTAALMGILAEPAGNHGLKYQVLWVLDNLLKNHVLLLTPEFLDLRVRLMNDEKESPLVRNRAMEDLLREIKQLPENEQGAALGKFRTAVGWMINDKNQEMSHAAWTQWIELGGLEPAVKTILNRVDYALKIKRATSRIEVLSRELSSLQRAFLLDPQRGAEVIKLIDQMHEAGSVSDPIFAMIQVMRKEKSLVDFAKGSLVSGKVNEALAFFAAYREHYFAGSRTQGVWGDSTTPDFEEFLSKQTAPEMLPFRLAVLVNFIQRVGNSDSDGRVVLTLLQEESIRNARPVRAAVKIYGAATGLLNTAIRDRIPGSQLLELYNWLWELDPAGVRASVEQQYSWSLDDLKSAGIKIPADWKSRKLSEPAEQLPKIIPAPGIENLFEKPLPKEAGGASVPALDAGGRPLPETPDLTPQGHQEKPKTNGAFPADDSVPVPPDADMMRDAQSFNGKNLINEVVDTLTGLALLTDLLPQPDAVIRLLAMLQSAPPGLQEAVVNELLSPEADNETPLFLEPQAVAMDFRAELRAQTITRLAPQLQEQRTRGGSAENALKVLRLKLNLAVLALNAFEGRRRDVKWTSSQVEQARALAAAFLKLEVTEPLIAEQEIDSAVIDALGDRQAQTAEVTRLAQTIGDVITLKPNVIVRVRIPENWMAVFESLEKSGRLPIRVVTDRLESKVLICHKSHADVSPLIRHAPSLRLTALHFSGAGQYFHTAEDAGRVPINYRERGTLSEVFTTGIMAATLSKEMLDDLLAFDQSVAKVHNQAALGTAGALMLLLAADARRTNSFAAAA